MRACIRPRKKSTTRERERQQAQQAFTKAQVAFAQVEERLRGLQTQHGQATRDHQQRHQELEQNRANVANLKTRLLDSQLAMLHASSTLAHAYVAKEQAQRQVADLAEQRDRKRLERTRLTQQAQTARVEWRSHQENVHQRELEATNLRHQRDTLVQRLRDDYQIEIADTLGHGPVAIAAADGPIRSRGRAARDRGATPQAQPTWQRPTWKALPRSSTISKAGPSRCARSSTT